MVLITETKLSAESVTAQFVDCSHYNVFRKDRDTGLGGGVLIMVKKVLPTIQLYDDSWNAIEGVVCQAKVGKKAVYLACIYRPPGSGSEYNERVCRTLQTICDKYTGQVLICGDFNFREINWDANEVNGSNSSEQAKFHDACENCYLFQHIRDFTRSRGMDEPSVLDLVFTKEELEIEHVCYKQPIGKSDHCVLLFEFGVAHTSDPIGQDTILPKRNYHKGRYAEATELFNAIPWDEEMHAQSVDAAWDIFLTHYNTIIDATVPFYPSKTRNRHKKWVNKQVLDQVRRKEEAWIRHRRNRKSKRLKKMYIEARNVATKTVRQAKYDFEHRLASEIKSDPRAFYSYARSKMSIKEELLAVRKKTGEMTTTMEDTCEVMNQQFQQVFRKPDNTEPPELEPVAGTKLEQCNIDLGEVLTLLQEQKTQSAPGPDGVHPVVLKACASSLARPLFLIFCRSLESGRLPKDWKRANVTPIFKKR